MALEVTSGTRNGIQKAAQPEPIEFKQSHKAVEAASSTAAIHEAVHIAKGNPQFENDDNSQGRDSEADSNRLKSAVKRANASLKSSRTRCEFAYHEETNRISIKVYDKDTEEVIREIPSEEALELIQKMYEMAGMLVDEKR